MFPIRPCYDYIVIVLLKISIIVELINCKARFFVDHPLCYKYSISKEESLSCSRL